VDAVTTALSPVLQWGFAGFALAQLVVLVWMVREFLGVMRSAIAAIPPLTETVAEVKDHVDEVRKVGENVRDRLLEFQCPYRKSDPGPCS
jgi:hypothetical protein